MYMILSVLFILLFYYIWKKQTFWQNQGVYVPGPFIPYFGHFAQISMVTDRWIKVEKIYNENYDRKFWGMYEILNPVMFVKDLDLIRNILIKDADHFIDRRKFKFTGADRILNEFLTVTKGEQWKKLRAISSPTFSTGKLKGMFPILPPICEELLSFLNEQTKEKGSADLSSGFGKYNTNVVASCIFGLELNCFKENTEFEKIGRSLVSMPLSRKVNFILMLLFPNRLLNTFGINAFGEEIIAIQKILTETMNVRKSSGIKRGDYIDILMEAYEECQTSDNPKYPMTMDTVIAGFMLFFFAGFDTTTTTLTVVTYYLSKHTDVQEKLRKELQEVVSADGFDYNTVMTAPYLDACFHESLRLSGPGHFLERLCTRDYIIPGTDVQIKQGCLISIPTYSIAHDSAHFDEPYEYKPERFLPENKEKIESCTYNGFGQGPRNCVAMRFALMVCKTVIAMLILDHRINLAPGSEKLNLDSSAGALRIGTPGVSIMCEKI